MLPGHRISILSEDVGWPGRGGGRGCEPGAASLGPGAQALGVRSGPAASGPGLPAAPPLPEPRPPWPPDGSVRGVRTNRQQELHFLPPEVGTGLVGPEGATIQGALFKQNYEYNLR